MVENARTTGAYLLERLRETFGDSPIVGEIRGIGMLAAMEIVRDRKDAQPFPNPDDPRLDLARRLRARPDRARAVPVHRRSRRRCARRPADVDRMVGILEELWPEAERHVLSAH